MCHWHIFLTLRRCGTAALGRVCASRKKSKNRFSGNRVFGKTPCKPRSVWTFFLGIAPGASKEKA
jgi:hypothetical protein